MTTFGIRIGEAFAGEGAEAAHVNVVIGDVSVLGPSFAQAIANQGPGHAPFVTVLRPSLPVRPLTLFVNKATIADERHGNLTWGAAQAGVAIGMTGAVAPTVPGGACPQPARPATGGARPQPARPATGGSPADQRLTLIALPTSVRGTAPVGMIATRTRRPRASRRRCSSTARSSSSPPASRLLPVS